MHTFSRKATKHITCTTRTRSATTPSCTKPCTHLIKSSLLHGQQLRAIVEAKPGRVTWHNCHIMLKAEHHEILQCCQVLCVQWVLRGPVIIDVRQENVVLFVLPECKRILPIDQKKSHHTFLQSSDRWSITKYNVGAHADRASFRHPWYTAP